MKNNKTGLKKFEAKPKQNYGELSDVYDELLAAEEELREQYKELQKSEELLRKSEERYKLAIDGANDVIWEWDIEHNRLFVSDKWTSITGYEIDDNTNIKFILDNLINPDDKDAVIHDLKEYFTERTPYYSSEFRIRTKAGEYRWIFNRGKVRRNNEGRPMIMSGSISDITERKKSQEMIRHLAYYDSLTNLPNRAFFMNKLNNALKESKEMNKKCAVIFIDLDDFKRINDTLGHSYGDELLKIIGSLLQLCTKDPECVARTGGDEFTVILNNISDANEVSCYCEKIVNLFKIPLVIWEKHIYSSASIAAAVFPDDGDDANSILKNADVAMHNAKESGKNKYIFYNSSMREELLRKAEIDRALRNALIDNEFNIYYQPQVDVKTGRIRGFEALLRWKSKTLGFVSPVEFISIAEETGLIIPIGEQVLRRVCWQNKIWRQKGYSYDVLAINVSPVQIRSQNFSNTVKEIINKTETKKGTIEFEITESVLIKYTDYNLKLINELKDAGIKFALDDFGTEYSSLNYLKLLPISTLKIDKSFIDHLKNSIVERAINSNIINLAHSINLSVVAEGVEEEEQVEILKDMNCDEIQGFYYSKPLPAEEAEKLLSMQKIFLT